MLDPYIAPISGTENKSSLRNVVIPSYLDFRPMDKV
jgi:hypothetical protein